MPTEEIAHRKIRKYIIVSFILCAAFGWDGLEGGKLFAYTEVANRREAIELALKDAKEARRAIMKRALDAFDTAPAEALPQEAIEPAKPPFEPINFNAPPQTNLRLSPSLRMGLALQGEYQREKNFDLRKGRLDNRTVFEPRLVYTFLYLPRQPETEAQYFLHMEAGRDITSDKRRGKFSLKKLDLLQLFGSFSLPVDDPGKLCNLKIGRQLFSDRRQWLYDEYMDGLRLFYQLERMTFELSAAKNPDTDLLNKVRVDRVSTFGFSTGYAFSEDASFRLYALKQFHKSHINDGPLFSGAELLGEGYWLEFAYVTGKDNSEDIRAFGFDIGKTYKCDSPHSPSLTVGYAYGSGEGDPSDGKNKDFRQTGLQDNEARFNGITTFKYYGELFDPELSNLSVFSAGLGIISTRNTSIDFMYHKYRQNELQSRIRDSEINANPSGADKDIGQEIDFIAGYRLKPHLRLNLVAGYFIPGKAFPNARDSALFLEAKARYAF